MTRGKAPRQIEGARLTISARIEVHREFSMIDLRELAEVGVRVLSEQGHDSATYELAGPAITLAEAISVAGRARGVELEARTVAWKEAPLPPRYAGTPSGADMRAMWQEYDRQGLRGNSNVLRMLLGREPAPFDQMATALTARG